MEDTFRNVFSDALSGVVEYLEQQGFRTETSIEWYEQEVSVYSEDIDRILNNIVSNIVKYADAGEPVRISSVSQDGYAGFVFENTVASVYDSSGCSKVPASGSRVEVGGGVESSGIGLRSIMKLMERAGGLCDIKQGSETFSIVVMFGDDHLSQGTHTLRQKVYRV